MYSKISVISEHFGYQKYLHINQVINMRADVSYLYTQLTKNINPMSYILSKLTKATALNATGYNTLGWDIFS